MAHCVNRSSEEFKQLAEQSNINPVILAAKISLWQEENGLDNFPNVEDIISTDKSIASAELSENLMKVAEKMGVSFKKLADYAKEAGLDTRGINAVADLARGVIAIAEQKEGVAITEEIVHIATAILEQTNPGIVTEMISKIDRFKIYNATLEQYRNNLKYQLPNGKPDIRKIKKEAVDKLIAELIVNDSQDLEQFPELREENNRSLIRQWWNNILDFIKGRYRQANISIFQEAGSLISVGEIEGTVADIVDGDVYYQLTTDVQKEIQSALSETRNSISKEESNEKVDPILMDTEEANNWYNLTDAAGNVTRVAKRVTDRVKAWYKGKFGTKIFTEQEKKFNELKRLFGVAGHNDFEEIHSRYYNKDGTRRQKPLDAPAKFNLPSQAMYNLLETYYAELVDSFPKDTLIFSETIIYDKKTKEAGTIDFLAIETSGRAHILDWKFMNITGDDVAWFKQGAFDIQLGRYKTILRENYGVKDFGMTRAIPIAMEFTEQDKEGERTLKGIAIGSVDAKKIEDLRLLPVPALTEATGIFNDDESLAKDYKALDKLITQLNAFLVQAGKGKVTEEEREFKIEKLNTLREAIRRLQVQENIGPLIELIQLMSQEGSHILNDYNVLYKDRPASSQDSTNKDLSDFANTMNDFIKLSDIFSSVSDNIGELIFKEEMLKNAISDEDKQGVLQYKEVLDDLKLESESIRKSRAAIITAAQSFYDKHMGERNGITFANAPEKVLKGLGSWLRGVSEQPLASTNILFKLYTNAQGKASADALTYIQRLDVIRKALLEKAGSDGALRKMVLELYQKDDDKNIANKLIYKYTKEFHETVDKKAEEGGDIKWLRDNIDVDAYTEEANKLIESSIDKIKKDRTISEETKDFRIAQTRRSWDINRSDFSGWNNYIIKRHPLNKWYSEEYKSLEKNPELMKLYNFLNEINGVAKDIGYIDNRVASHFIPFVRKSMAEELGWEQTISPVKRITQSLTMQSGEAGLGSYDAVTGQLENSIPKYYTHDFTYNDEGGPNDYTDVSLDLFRNMNLYINQVQKYKYFDEVEGQLDLIKTLETFKNHLNTDIKGNVVEKDGSPEVIAGNEENANMYDLFLKILLYEQKYPLTDYDLPFNIGEVKNFIKNSINLVAGKEVFGKEEDPSSISMMKVIDATNNAFQLKTLGLELISGAISFFGGNLQVAAQAGAYFNAREVAKNEGKLIGNYVTFNKAVSEDEKAMYSDLVNIFMPLKDDPSYKIIMQSGMHELTRHNLSDMLMVFMRKPEHLLEHSIFLTLLENTMIEDGKIVSIPIFVKAKYADRHESGAKVKESKKKIADEIEELKKTRSIAVTKKLENGKLVIPGFDLNNREEIQRLTNLTRRISRDAVGGMSNGDVTKAGANILLNSAMIFKKWIPKLTDTRFSEFRKVSDDFSVRINEKGEPVGERYDIGRIRLLASVINRSVKDKVFHLGNILKLNDKGLAQLDLMFEEYAAEYERNNGKKLYMSRADFIDMIEQNLRKQLQELAMIVGMMGMLFSMGIFAPDDDDDKASKNFYRYSRKVIKKFMDELTFFYSPTNYGNLLTGSVFPALSLVTDIGKFFDHFFIEVTGIDFNSSTTDDEAREKAMPIKYLAKAMPITKSVLTYRAILDSEFAKEYKMTIQEENNMK